MEQENKQEKTNPTIIDRIEEFVRMELLERRDYSASKMCEKILYKIEELKERPNDEECEFNLTEKGFVFLDEEDKPFYCRMWGKDAWLFYWIDSQKKWVSLRKITRDEIWNFSLGRLKNKDAEIYFASYCKTPSK